MVLFMRGEFSPNDVNQTALSLYAFGLGLISFMLIKVLAPGYYSRQDTKTPVRYGIIAMVSNMVFNAMLAWHLSYVGLALATSLSAFINMALLYRGLHQQGVYQVTMKTISFIIRLVIAGAAMVAVIIWQLDEMSQWLEWDLTQRAMTLMMLIIMGAMSYLVSLFVLGIRPKDLKAATD